jgi:hypothetical protein
LIAVSDHCGEIPSTSSTLKRAASVKVGECVLTVAGDERVVSNVDEGGAGVYTAVTMEKDALLVVNGIVASPFAVNHAVGNTFYQLHRFAYAVAPSLVATPLFSGVQAFVGDLSLLFAK